MENSHRRTRRIKKRSLRFNFKKQLNLEGTNYDIITSVAYLNEKYGLRKSHYIEKFIKCIHRKINVDASKINDQFINDLSPWVKSKLFLLLVTLSERGGPEYWLDKNDQLKIMDKDEDDEEINDGHQEKKENKLKDIEDQNVKAKSVENTEFDKNVSKKSTNPNETTQDETESKTNSNLVSQPTTTALSSSNADEVDNDPNRITTLTEHIIQQNINQDFTESKYDENYVFSSIWANFMEGLINHYLEKIIVPHSEMKVCQQLYKPMMKIISLYNEYNELIEKSEKNGFLPNETLIKDETDLISQERLQRAQKLLWQARQDIPKTISKELTLLSEMYSTLSADEQDYELDEFVCSAEEYIESEFLPILVDVLLNNCGTNQFWKVLLVLEPFFYYIEDVGESEEETLDDNVDDDKKSFKPDPRVITLEKICEVAAKQKWI